MRRLKLPHLVAVAAVFAAAVPTAALHGPTGDKFTPNLRTERVYFHCTGPVPKVHTQNTGPIGWDTTAPTQSVQQGAGCGSVDNGLQGVGQGQQPQDTHFAGTYAGNIDVITVELHNIYAGPARATGPFPVHVRLRIDDTDIFGTAGREVVVTPVPSATKLSEKVLFSITNIGLLDEANDRSHTILLTVTGGAVVASPLPNNPVRDSQNIWVYDTTEVPSGLTFAPPKAEAATLRR